MNSNPRMGQGRHNDFLGGPAGTGTGVAQEPKVDNRRLKMGDLPRMKGKLMEPKAGIESGPRNVFTIPNQAPPVETGWRADKVKTMGTNYYWHDKPPCECCHRPYDPIHIGKSSAGWCFALHVIPEEGINDLEDWEKLWEKPGSEIYDEYGAKITSKNMKKWISGRKGVGSLNDFDFQGNYAERGPKNLIRHKIGFGCVKHGKGTWDCIVGEFS